MKTRTLLTSIAVLLLATRTAYARCGDIAPDEQYAWQQCPHLFPAVERPVPPTFYQCI